MRAAQVRQALPVLHAMQTPLVRQALRGSQAWAQLPQRSRMLWALRWMRVLSLLQWMGPVQLMDRLKQALVLRRRRLFTECCHVLFSADKTAV